MIGADQLLADLSVFSDLGVHPVHIADGLDGELNARLTRNGDELRLRFLPDGKVLEEASEGTLTKHASYKSLLASDRFGRLREWAGTQSNVLGEAFSDPTSIIPVMGYLHSKASIVDVQGLSDALIVDAAAEPRVGLMLIDGPAGIGKTEFIRQLTFDRARSFSATQLPLILHVQSRGRVLTFLQDLIAFSLQTLRLSVTFDQIPILVRNGLVTLAIDGFDELGDPSGYGSAWAQVNDLIGQVRGQGTIILAGRETFIGRERILRDIKGLKSSDQVDSLSLQLPDPSLAKAWLIRKGWAQDKLDNLEELFEPGAFSLRPLFLRRLGEIDVSQRLSTEAGDGPLSLLVDTMIEREAQKFGDQVDAVFDTAARERFIRTFLGEIARDMADNQSEATDEVSLVWAVESALADGCPDEIKRLLINRALVVAFLAPDERPRYRRFSHSQLQNYFLGLETIAALSRGEVPKYLRRNLMGADFLVTFTDVVDKVAASDNSSLKLFISSALNVLGSYADIDRGARNLAALILCCAPYADIVGGVTLNSSHIDDALIRGIATNVSLSGCSINQLDVRSADVEAVDFSNSSVFGLVMNNRTRVSKSLNPLYIQMESETSNEVSLITDERHKLNHLAAYGGTPIDHSADEEREATIRNSPLWRLFDRVLRYRGHWLRDDSDDILAAKITEAAEWPALLELLRKHGFVREENRDASGRSAKFYHVRSIEALAASVGGAAVEQFYSDLRAAIAGGLD